MSCLTSSITFSFSSVCPCQAVFHMTHSESWGDKYAELLTPRHCPRRLEITSPAGKQDLHRTAASASTRVMSAGHASGTRVACFLEHQLFQSPRDLSFPLAEDRISAPDCQEDGVVGESPGPGRCGGKGTCSEEDLTVPHSVPTVGPEGRVLPLYLPRCLTSLEGLLPA